jgi:hypothetical protein
VEPFVDDALGWIDRMTRPRPRPSQASLDS